MAKPIYKGPCPLAVPVSGLSARKSASGLDENQKGRGPVTLACPCARMCAKSVSLED